MTDENNLESKGGSLTELKFPFIHCKRRNQEKATSWTIVNINE
jgi:hypothetical protein